MSQQTRLKGLTAYKRLLLSRSSSSYSLAQGGPYHHGWITIVSLNLAWLGCNHRGLRKSYIYLLPSCSWPISMNIPVLQGTFIGWNHKQWSLQVRIEKKRLMKKRVNIQSSCNYHTTQQMWVSGWRMCEGCKYARLYPLNEDQLEGESWIMRVSAIPMITKG